MRLEFRRVLFRSEKKIPSGVLKLMQLTPPKRQAKRKCRNGAVEIFDVNGVKFEMVCVEGGSFMMGSEDGFDDEEPVHTVTLDHYAIGKTQVTQALWQAVMGSNPSNNIGATHPVEKVSWDDCQLFIEKLNQLTGKRFSLPTEAQWEFAARGGNLSKGYTYAGSNDLNSVGWYNDNSGNQTHPVGEKHPNELGLFDMSGNVWEWCWDWFDANYYSRSPERNPQGPDSGSGLVYRGGSRWNSAESCRVSFRSYNYPFDRCNDMGLRLSLSL